jgi:hypothetical protein
MSGCRTARKVDAGAGRIWPTREVGIERSHQVHDLPEVRIRITVSQHDVYRVRCACGAEHLGSLPGEVSAAPTNYGVNLKTLTVYLLVYQHVPVQRCVQLIADLRGGPGPSDGFVHGMLARCATAVAEVVSMIKTLITMTHVVGFDETTLRCGPAGQKKYVLSASTENATIYHLGGRDLDSFAEAGILPEFAGVAVHDRYGNYFHRRWENPAGHQACTAHLLRDFADADEAYPGAHWPAQAQRALRDLIRAWHTARDHGLAEIAEDIRNPLILEFRRAIAGAGAPGARPAPQHRATPWAGPARVLPRPRTRRGSLQRRHPDLAHEQHQRARPAAHQNPAEDLRPVDQRRGHPKSTRHPQLHRHHPQARRRRHHRTTAGDHRQPLETTAPRSHLSTRTRRSHHHAHCGFALPAKSGT